MKLHPAAWSLFLLLATGIVVLGFQAVQPTTGQAPAFTSPTTHNATFDLGALRGQVVVLDFFQIDCPSCVILENALQEVAPTWNASRVHVASVGLAPDNSVADLRTYQEQHNLSWTVVTDQDGALGKFSVIGFPTLVIVNTDGTIALHKSGPVPAREIQTVVTQALAAPTPEAAYAQYSLWALAAVAGVAAFFSPCAIGLLPGYVAHAVRVDGPTAHPMRRAATQGIVAAAGLLLVFLGLGGLAAAFGRTLTPYLAWVAPFAGAVFILVGLLLLVRPYSTFLQRVFGPLTTITRDGPEPGHLSFFLYGIGYGAGAAGCTAPVLLNLAALGAVAGAKVAVGLVALYAFTGALLMAVLTMIVAGGKAGVAATLSRHSHKVEVASALVFVGAGVFLLAYAWRAGLF